MRCPKRWRFESSLLSFFFLWCKSSRNFQATIKNTVLRQKETKMMAVWDFVSNFILFLLIILSWNFQATIKSIELIHKQSKMMAVQKLISDYCFWWMPLRNFQTPAKNFVSRHKESKLMMVWKLIPEFLFFCVCLMETFKLPLKTLF